jgi:Flp pilus assembly protein TadG
MRIPRKKLLRRGSNFHTRRARRGSQLLEMAIGFNVLLFLSFGMVEFGQYFYIKHCFESAVRDGARYGILSTATQAQVVSTITTTLAQANVTYNASWLTMKDLSTGSTVTDVSTIPAGDQLQLTLSTTYGNIPNAVRPLYSITGQGIGSNKVMSATCIMVKE